MQTQNLGFVPSWQFSSDPAQNPNLSPFMSSGLSGPGLGSFLDSVGGAAANIVTDPCLSDVSNLINSLHTGGSAPSDGTASGDGSPGIGLCSAVGPLTVIVWASQNKALAVLGLMGFLGLFVGMGYKLGKRSKAA